MRRTTKSLLLFVAMLALTIGQANAQRCLPGMKGVQFTADMADGFYSKTSRNDAGFAFGLSVSTYTKSGNQWKFGGEIMQRYYPYRFIGMGIHGGRFYETIEVCCFFR